MAFPSYRPTCLATAAILGLGVLAAPLRDARADNVGSTGKGIVGGALLGGEVVTMVEAIAGMRSGWAYGISGVIGAAGGGVGGYFVEKGSSDGRAPTYMLAGGLALVIPAFVLVLNATRYIPEEGVVEDRAPTAPAAEPGTPGGSVTGSPLDLPPSAPPAPSAPAAPSAPPATTAPPAPPPPAPPTPAAPPAPPPQSLLDVHRGSWRVGVPVPDVRPVYSVAEQVRFGTRPETELRWQVLHMTF